MEIRAILLLMTLFLSFGNGCKPSIPSRSTFPQIDSSKLKLIQERTFHATKQSAFSASLSVFQDLGYVIENADIESGLIFARTPIKKVGNAFFPFFNMKGTMTIQKTKTDSVIGRLNFIRVYSKGLQSIKEEEIETDVSFYLEVFEKIESRISLRQKN